MHPGGGALAELPTLAGEPAAARQRDRTALPAPESGALRKRVLELEGRVRQAEERRRAILHIMGDLNESNRRLADQRKAMIHIMGDLRETTAEIQRREQELRDKQEQLVQAGKMATLGELTTGVAHELNNPLNNIGLFVGNVIDHVRLRRIDEERILHDLEKVMGQVKKATEIISHLRTFGRAAPVSIEMVSMREVIERSLSLMREQLRLRQIDVRVGPFQGPDPVVIGNSIQLEQVVINLLTNARDALEGAARKVVWIECSVVATTVVLVVRDTGPGIPDGLEQRIFDPFFTTKEVGSGTGLGLSITYAILEDHGGTIAVENLPGEGASFRVELPLAAGEPPRSISR
jgi:C4-dicarboxylate-specific signal transduction histidine kinase